jgi:hypothetical protein
MLFDEVLQLNRSNPRARLLATVTATSTTCGGFHYLVLEGNADPNGNPVITHDGQRPVVAYQGAQRCPNDVPVLCIALASDSRLAIGTQ